MVLQVVQRVLTRYLLGQAGLEADEADSGACTLAPNAKLRAQVVPQGPDEGAEAAQPAACEANCGHHRPARMSWAKLLERVFGCDITWVQVSLR